MAGSGGRSVIVLSNTRGARIDSGVLKSRSIRKVYQNYKAITQTGGISKRL